jgi:DNA repair protein RadA/Sms
MVHPKFLRCDDCGEWDSSGTAAIGSISEAKTTTLDRVEAMEVERIVTGGPWDPAWGGGIVPTSTTLMGGSAGLGKSTMIFQVASRVAEITGKRSYFLSAEQGPGEIRIMANRLQIPNLDRIRVMSEFGSGAEVDEGLLKRDPPGMFVVDSISALVGKDVHAAIIIARRFKQYSTRFKAPTVLICHMTKENDFAGLTSLQHEVDTLMTLFANDEGQRELKSWKNRFGPTFAEYPLVMTELGLFAPPPKPEKPDKKSKKAFSIPVAANGTANVVDQNVAGSEPRAKKAKPDTIEVNGQKLVRHVRGAKKDIAKAVKGVEGEALKWKRPPVARTKEAKVAAAKRRVKKEKSKTVKVQSKAAKA